MNRCLRCSKECGTATFCHQCQSSLLNRFQQKEGYETVPILPQALTPTIVEPGSSDPTLQSSRIIPPQDLQIDDVCENALLSRVLVLRKRRRFQIFGLPLFDENEQTRLDPKGRWSRRRMTAVERVRLMRIAFATLTLLAIVALIIDGVLVSFVFKHHHGGIDGSGTFPMLALTPSVVYPGQVVQLHLSHFGAASRVLLTRDVAESVRTDLATPLVQMGPTGEADVHVLVEDGWGPGFHLLEAEDINAHYTASVPLNVIGSGPARKPQLVVNQSTLDMGGDLQGATTIQPLILRNAGDGIISWAVKSDQSWLMLSPAQGTFSQSQRISVVVSRARLKPGNYAGILTFVTNTNTSVIVHVTMSVQPLPADPGAVLVVTPPVLAFSASDGGADPAEQSLTISNPGTRPLDWSLGGSTPTVSVNQEMPFLSNMNWLNVVPASGTVAPGATEVIHAVVHSRALLPSVYTGMMLFTSGQDVLNNPQAVAVSLDVEPRCSIATSRTSLDFTVMAGQSKAQPLDLAMQNGCSGSIAWQAFSSSDWLTISPSSGQVREKSATATTVGVNSSLLQPGTYSGSIVFLTAQRTQTLAVQLTVASTASSGATSPAAQATATAQATAQLTGPPVLAVSSSAIAFSMTRGQSDPPGQAVSLANTGGGSLSWQVRVSGPMPSWLAVSAMSGRIAAGQTAQVVLTTSGAGLSPGTYTKQVVVTASDDAGAQVQGSPQSVQVTLTVFQPCTLQVAPGSISFSSSLLQPNPPDQSITIQEVGDCARPVHWSAAVDTGGHSWLSLSATSGSNTSTITVHANTQGVLLGNYKAQVTISATDSNGTSLQNNSQTVTVTLTVSV